VKLQHVRFDMPMPTSEVPRFQLYLGEGFWDLMIGQHRWRWFW
jgi:hypothetical protein